VESNGNIGFAFGANTLLIFMKLLADYLIAVEHASSPTRLIRVENLFMDSRPIKDRGRTFFALALALNDVKRELRY
jgi:hypothetical protein